MAKPLAVVGAIAVIAGGAAIGYAVTRQASGGMSGEQTVAMATAVANLDGAISAARAAVHTSARDISTRLTVQAAIATSAESVADQVVHGELAFHPDKGDSIELGRIVRPGNTVESLTVQPTGAMRASHDGRPDVYADLDTDHLVITEVAKIDPPQDADRYTGFVAVSHRLALAPALQPLIAAGITGKLVVGDKSAAIGAMPADAATHDRPLASQPGAKLVVAEPAPHAVLPMPALVGGIAAGLVGLVLLLIGVLRRDPATTGFHPIPAQPTVPPPSASAIGSAQTQLSQHSVNASGTPAPVDPAAASQIVPSNLSPGSMIGRWEVVRRLGSGGMADVYLAQARGDGGFEKLVAIKVMHSHLARSQRAVDHFLDEARLAARIHHPNVVAIQDLGKIGNDYVIVMEYVEGVDLERLLLSARAGERPVPLPVALGILTRICDGLDAAHRATAPDGTPLGIIHRDVKSANVLVSRQGSVKVVDFGIAKAAKQVHYTVAGETKGTPAMMAPEQRVGEQVDVRADVYSVAAVGFELVTGHAVNLDLAALAHLGVENWPHLPAPSSLRPGLPAELDQILLHAMAFERERRPADCAAFGALCEAVIKRYNLIASDKDLARWVDGELRHLSPAFQGASTGFSRSPSA